MIAEGKQKFNDEIKVLLFTDSFESKVKSLIEMYESIVELIRKFRQKDYSIADAVEDWLTLYSSSIKGKLTSSIENHLEEILQPVSVTANLLHPKYRGCKLCANEIGIDNKYLLEILHDEGLNQLTDYKN